MWTAPLGLMGRLNYTWNEQYKLQRKCVLVYNRLIRELSLLSDTYTVYESGNTFIVCFNVHWKRKQLQAFGLTSLY